MIYQDRKISETASFMILVNFCRTLLFDYSPNIADSVSLFFTWWYRKVGNNIHDPQLVSYLMNSLQNIGNLKVCFRSIHL